MALDVFAGERERPTSKNIVAAYQEECLRALLTGEIVENRRLLLARDPAVYEQIGAARLSFIVRCVDERLLAASDDGQASIAGGARLHGGDDVAVPLQHRRRDNAVGTA